MPEEDRHNELFRRYLAEIAGEPLLSADEELRIARAARDGDAAAGHLLIRSNLKLVVAVARKYTGSGVPLLDLVQEGNLGLMQAVDNYDPDRGFAFRTFATWWIRQAITRGIAANGGSSPVRTETGTFEGRLQDAWDGFVAQHRRQPTVAELAASLGVDDATVIEALGTPPPAGNGPAPG